MDHFGSLSALFEANQRDWLGIPDVPANVLRNLNRDEAMKFAESELEFINQRGIDTVFFQDVRYPQRLKHCSDAPILLYGQGDYQMNVQKSVAIVGTRKCTSYGRRLTGQLIENLVPYDPLIVSGLASGIDTIAHQSSVDAGLQTIGVLGHSLDRIYPRENGKLAEQMLKHGGMLTEFESGTQPDRENFPQRNRIVAGMADVTVVVETALKGGSMITARLAAGYSRDVACFPGGVDAPHSGGCNHLIKTNQAALIETVDDLIYLMGWEKQEKANTPQKQLFVDLSTEEERLVKYLSERENESLDNLSLACGWPVSKTSTVLLELEFKGVVQSLPGKQYTLT